LDHAALPGQRIIPSGNEHHLKNMVFLVMSKDIINTTVREIMPMTLLRNQLSKKAHQLLTSPETWCQESPAEDQLGHKLQASDPRAVKWCALGAIQRTYPPSGWGDAMDQVLLALNFSEAGLAQMNKTDKACSLMEWNDDRQSSFQEIRGIFLDANI
jgi:hypothetical protein